jgi:ABC-type nitrate/sulfonate/bicarbonate transport system substrate-binding protein
VFVDQIAPKAGLKKTDWQEVRMNVTDMVAAMAAKTIDAMVNVEPYNVIAEAEGLATTVMNYWTSTACRYSWRPRPSSWTKIPTP